MANVFQAATSGYRDPYKMMTLQALEARAKAAQDAAQQAGQPQQIASPFQGIANVINAAGSGINAARLTSAEASGRADLADAMAHIDMQNGPDAATIARISVRDPQLASHLYDQAMERKNKQDEMKFQAGEHAMDRSQRADLQAEAEKATASEGALQRGSTEGIATRGQEAETGRTNITQAGENARTAATLGSQQTLENQREGAASLLEGQKADEALNLERTKAGLTPNSGVGKIVTDYNKGQYNMPGEDQNHPNTLKRVNDAITAENAKNVAALPPNAYSLEAARSASARHDKIIASGDAARSYNANIERIVELGKGLETGPQEKMLMALAPYAAAAGIKIDNMDKYQAYSSIVESLAPGMRIEGAGSSSDTDVRMFLNSLPSIGNYPEANDIISGTLMAASKNKMDASQIAQQARLPVGDPNHLEWWQVDQRIAALPDPFSVANEKIAKIKADRAAGATGGGGGGKPREFHYDENGNPIQ